jgi:hypothetical protein
MVYGTSLNISMTDISFDDLYYKHNAIIVKGYRTIVQGKRILILHLSKTGQNLEQIILVPTRQEAFAFEAPLASFLLLE